MNRYSHPETPYLPWSPSVAKDGIVSSVDWKNQDIVVLTEKLDGQNVSIYYDGYVHARSIDDNKGVHLSAAKHIAATIMMGIRSGIRLCGELMTYRHSVNYDTLDSHFYLHSAWISEYCLSWGETVKLSRSLGIPTVPVLFIGATNSLDIVNFNPMSSFGQECEGYVIRRPSGFYYNHFRYNVAKSVRKNHVQPNAEHWSKRLIENSIGRKDLHD